MDSLRALQLVQLLHHKGDKTAADAELLREASRRVGTSLLTQPFLSVQSHHATESAVVSDLPAAASNRLAWRVGMASNATSIESADFGDSLKTRQLQCHFRCSMDFLARSGLVDARAKPRYPLRPTPV
jgi:hypothetical protein